MSVNSQERINRLNPERSLKDLSINTAALLCYVGIWVSGIIFLVLEQKNRFIRFHALQSIITFGVLMVAGSILGRFPVVGGWLSGTVSVAGFILWIILMVKAGQGELFKLPWVGDLAERLAQDSIPQPPPAPPVRQESPILPTENLSVASPQVPPVAQPTPDFQPATAFANPVTTDTPLIQSTPKSKRTIRAEDFRDRYYSFNHRAGRVVGSAFAIAWSVALIIFFNFYHQYIAYYNANTASGRTIWELSPLVTSDFSSWLPIATIALAVTIIGHVLMIAYDRYIFRQISHIVIDIFSLASIITLVSIFPFEFSPIPNLDVVQGLEIGLPIGLILISVGIGIGILVRFITMLVHLAEGKY